MNVDGKVLCALDYESLKELGINKIGKRLDFLNEISVLTGRDDSLTFDNRLEMLEKTVAEKTLVINKLCLELEQVKSQSGHIKRVESVKEKPKKVPARIFLHTALSAQKDSYRTIMVHDKMTSKEILQMALFKYKIPSIANFELFIRSDEHDSLLKDSDLPFNGKPLVFVLKPKQMTEYPEAIVIKDFYSMKEDEIDLKQNEVIQVLEKPDNDWWIVRKNEDKGYCPASCLLICPENPIKFLSQPVEAKLLRDFSESGIPKNTLVDVVAYTSSTWLVKCRNQMHFIPEDFIDSRGLSKAISIIQSGDKTTAVRNSNASLGQDSRNASSSVLDMLLSGYTRVSVNEMKISNVKASSTELVKSIPFDELLISKEQLFQPNLK